MNKAERRAYERRWRQEHPENCKKNREAWRVANVERVKELGKANRLATRLAVISAYGGRCACCGETEVGFLTIDHKMNDGAQHRREIGPHIYAKVKKAGFPKDRFQLLCWNCNCGRAYNHGTCPHQAKKEDLALIEEWSGDENFLKYGNQGSGL